MMHVKRRGAIIVLMMVALGAILIISAFCINIAYMQLVRTELRAASDAAARAGAEALAREDSPDAAIAAAIANAARNKVGNGKLRLTAADIELGKANRNAKGEWEFDTRGAPLSAVRIHAGASTNLMMSGLTGRKSFAPEMVSTAAFSTNEICLVVDRSHSMCFDLSGDDWVYPSSIPPAPPDQVVYPPDDNDSRWAYLERAIDVFLAAIETTNLDQRVGLITWGSDISLRTFEGRLTGRTFPATALDCPLGAAYPDIRNAIYARGDDVMLGATNCSAGIDMGISELTGTRSHANSNKIMILMTDGKWNAGRKPSDAARDAKKLGITIHTITFLDKADQSEMVKVARATGGFHYHASNGEELEEAFRELARHLPVALTD
ncbi:MAG: vWA domain-containing protein [Pirellulales bacterium]